MAEVKVGEIAVGAVNYPVAVSTHGYFTAYPPDTTDYKGSGLACALTLAECTTKLKAKLKTNAARVKVPFAVATNNHVIRRGIARGIHGTSGDILVTWEDGEKDTLRGYSDAGMVAMTEQEQLAIEGLGARVREAEEALRAVREPFDQACKPFERGARYHKADRELYPTHPTLRDEVAEAIKQVIEPETTLKAVK